MPFDHAISDQATLREVYREAHPMIRRKVVDRIDEPAAAFIARSPFFVMATASAGVADASPRGGPPGFVQVLDERRLAFGDLNGNNLLDSFTHLVVDPAISLMFVVPGLGETLRVAGRATLTTDPAILERTAIDGRLPNVAVGVDVDRCFVHCSKAFRRSQLWDPTSWPEPEDRPSPARILIDAMELQATPEQVEADLDSVRHFLWQPAAGAEDPVPE